MLVYETFCVLGLGVVVQFFVMKSEMGKYKYICGNVERIYRLFLSVDDFNEVFNGNSLIQFNLVNI